VDGRALNSIVVPATGTGRRPVKMTSNPWSKPFALIWILPAAPGLRNSPVAIWVPGARSDNRGTGAAVGVPVEVDDAARAVALAATEGLGRTVATAQPVRIAASNVAIPIDPANRRLLICPMVHFIQCGGP